MDIQTLAQQLVAFLTPFLPYLLKAGEKAAEEAGEKFTDEVWEKAQALWGKLRGKKRVAQAAEDVAATPDDPDAQAALRLQLKKALAEDEELAAEISRLWQGTQTVGTTVTASGTRSVAIGGDVSDSTIVTGNRNVVQTGKYNIQIGQATGIAIGDRARVENLTPGSKPVG